MDHTDSMGSYLDIDLESGETKNEEDGSKGQVMSGGNSKKLLSRVRSGFLGGESPHGSQRVRDRSSSCDIFYLDEISATNMEIKLGKVREEMDQEKSKKPNSIPPKPPRPPKGPSLDAADVKMLKEISMLKSKRKQRMEKSRPSKTIKKEKVFSLNSNLLAMFVTAIFFYVIIFQGFLGSRM